MVLCSKKCNIYLETYKDLGDDTGLTEGFEGEDKDTGGDNDEG